MAIKDYFTTAANNDTSGGLWQEGMARSDVNNSARQMQADLRNWYNEARWIEHLDGEGDGTVSYVSATSFTVDGADVTAVYHAGRRVRAQGASTGTIYGTITGATFSTDTTVTVDWDDDGALANESIQVWIGIEVQQNVTLPDVALQRPNLLPNGEFQVWQRGTSFTATTSPANNDDEYLVDQCVLLSDGNDIVDVLQDSVTKPVGAYASMKADVETANKKFGFLFPLEQRDAAAVIGGKASLSFKARKGGSNSTLETIRAAVIAWSSTADSITSDVVSAWNVAGTNPTLVANWTYENTPFSITLGTSFKEYRLNNIAIDTGSTTNVAVFIWVDDTDATVADELFLADVNLVAGEFATPIMRRPFSEALRMNQRYFCKTFPYATVPAQNAGTDGAITTRANLTNGRFNFHWRFPVEMRVSPTTFSYNPSAANNDARNIGDNTDTDISIDLVGTSGLSATHTTPDANDAGDRMAVHFAAAAGL